MASTTTLYSIVPDGEDNAIICQWTSISASRPDNNSNLRCAYCRNQCPCGSSGVWLATVMLLVTVTLSMCAPRILQQ